ncbi:tRNA pseudouridine(38-40) synthase TruA [Parvularcula lutaonensis]|uniref:tRNA pseudouridine synthase A n=1 Tax=Parvularcula lutaonensis TaxID=491923 RepID=A0ABV7MBX9_9PROT|nr:tRNA pseudouridine(38-40) synthase TruA [Parvularcula lutaonensis]GGY37523.1 tRNA pseudouridine synthase A [Parvularcula lutaonensis]
MSEEPSTRHRIEIEYDGQPFAGWQRQENAPSVQATIEDAAAKFSGGKTHCYGAGRTDAGVHALCMTAHLDLEKPVASFTVQNAVNALMRPAPVAILSATPVTDDFHARFSAKERHYLYRIIARRAPLALDQGRAWQVPYALDDRAMADAAEVFVGLHDFTTFRSAHCQSKSPVKTLTEVSVERSADEIQLRLRAPSFLHNQVRSIVGTLERVGAGRWSKGDVQDALEAADRSRCGPVAPAQGLYFVKAVY